MIVVLLAWMLGGCNQVSSTNIVPTDKVIGGELLFTMDSEKMKEDMLSSGFSVVENMNVHGVKVYKIPYITKDDKNHNIQVSGLLSVPIGVKNSVGSVSYNHGTIALNSRAPTVKSIMSMYPSTAAYFFTSIGGFATLEADYIGYGDSTEHYHPYMLKDALANTSVDFIKAVKKFTKQNSIKLNNQLYVTGYSEGGYVTMATLNKLEKMHIPVSAAAPMAGAYDLNYMARAVLGLENESLKSYAMTYTILTLNAYAKSYGKNITSIIKEPYASKIDGLLDGKHSFSQIDNALPVDEVGKDGLLKQDFLNRYQDTSKNWFQEALNENSLHNWSPKSMLKLIHCQGDDQVPYTISKRTLNAMKRNGSKNVSLITPDLLEKADKKWDHGKCFMPSMQYVAEWFVQVRENQKKKND